jgi:hypothetical protein
MPKILKSDMSQYSVTSLLNTRSKTQSIVNILKIRAKPNIIFVWLYGEVRFHVWLPTFFGKLLLSTPKMNAQHSGEKLATTQGIHGVKIERATI